MDRRQQVPGNAIAFDKNANKGEELRGAIPQNQMNGATSSITGIS